MGNSISIDSYLDRHQCSGRNITWQYMHNNGSLPSPYSSCPFASDVLSSHCCSKGVCNPSWSNREFDRYPNYDWDGLGDPYKHATGEGNATKVEHVPAVKGRLAKRWACLGINAGPGVGGTHWPPLGLDGRPVKNFTFKEWVVQTPTASNKVRQGTQKKKAAASNVPPCNGSTKAAYLSSSVFCEGGSPGMVPRSVPMSLTQYYESNVSNTAIAVIIFGLVGVIFLFMVVLDVRAWGRRRPRKGRLALAARSGPESGGHLDDH